MTETLQKLFGSAARVKLLRLFLFNQDHYFTASEAATRVRVPSASVRGEIQMLNSIGFLSKIVRSQGTQYAFNPAFAYAQAIQSLILNTPVRGEDVYKKIEKVGNIKLVVLSGIFT